jgi:1-acyl-sn-glycerol-3-phosphate acyltransferase
VGNCGDPAIVRTLRGWGPGTLAMAVGAVLRGRPRSLAADSARILLAFQPPPVIEGRENIPSRQAFVLVGNHFQAPGLWVGMVCLAITRAVAEARAPGGQELHWLGLSDWRWLQFRGRWLPNPLTAVVFPRALRVWGCVPTPSDPADVAGRARALRQILKYLGRRGPHAAGEPQPVAIFPEGTGTIALEEARPGSGAFVQRLSAHGFPVLPVGQWQRDDGRIVIRFGQPFALGEPALGSGLSLDDWARQKMMARVGSLLPPELWGVYAAAVAREMAEQTSGPQAGGGEHS